MSGDFELDEDDLLFDAICAKIEKATDFTKRSNESNTNENLIKKQKTSQNSLSPVIEPYKNQEERVNISKNVSKYTPVKRLFPGPAGILSDENTSSTSNLMDVCSQNTSSIFQDEIWKRMANDFKISSSVHLHDKFNIAWIKKEANANQFTTQKAPFLAAVLISLEVSDGQTQKSVNVTLKDQTGTIQGNILFNLYEEFASYLTLGSILVLVQFGIFSCTCDKCDNFHLTITPKSLSAIYNGKEKVVIQKIDPSQILADFCRQKKDKAMQTHTSSHPVHNSSLNNKIGLSNCSKMPIINILKQNDLKTSFEDKFSLPTLHNVCTKTTQDLLGNTPTKMKLFTFKKVSSTDTQSEEKHQLSSDLKDSLTSNVSPSYSNTNAESEKNCEPKNKSNLVPQSDEKHDNLNKLNEDSLKTDSKISVRIANKEDEILWKDALADVDINSFFEDDL